MEGSCIKNNNLITTRFKLRLFCSIFSTLNLPLMYMMAYSLGILTGLILYAYFLTEDNDDTNNMT